MYQLMKLFWEISLLRKGPQDVPGARVLFWPLLLAGFFVDLFMAVNFVDIQSAISLVLANTLLLFGLVILLLYVFRYQNRIMQTLICLIGTGLIFSFIRMPLMYIFKFIPNTPGIFGMLEIGVLIWSLFVIAHILRHALSIEFMLAGMLSFGYFMVSYQLANYFLPQAG